jgi:hypothetical protein
MFMTLPLTASDACEKTLRAKVEQRDCPSQLPIGPSRRDASPSASVQLGLSYHNHPHLTARQHEHNPISI